VLTHNYDKIFQELRANSDIHITRLLELKVHYKKQRYLINYARLNGEFADPGSDAFYPRNLDPG
jgi:hypothetical protein